MLEYILIIALIALAVVGVFVLINNKATKFSNSADNAIEEIPIAD